MDIKVYDISYPTSYKYFSGPFSGAQYLLYFNDNYEIRKYFVNSFKVDFIIGTTESFPTKIGYNPSPYFHIIFVFLFIDCLILTEISWY